MHFLNVTMRKMVQKSGRFRAKNRRNVESARHGDLIIAHFAQDTVPPAQVIAQVET